MQSYDNVHGLISFKFLLVATVLRYVTGPCFVLLSALEITSDEIKHSIISRISNHGFGYNNTFPPQDCILHNIQAGVQHGYKHSL